MQTFLEEVVKKLIINYKDISALTIILPSKRAGVFLKKHLLDNIEETLFSPRIISIEEFIEELSGLTIADNTLLLFKSYEVYKSTNPSVQKEDFETYISWANTLLNDFNEIDRYLLEPKQFFTYLSGIKTLEKWGVTNEKTTLVKNYLQFWESLLGFYEEFTQTLIENQIGYQGLVYRVASQNIEHYKKYNNNTPHVFIGFNALNKAEQTIIQELLETGNTEVFWDLDTTLYEDKKHAASYFLREYVSNWKYYKTPKNIGLSNHFSEDKKFQFIETQKNITQVKYVSDILSTLSKEQLNTTAIVLADESLLIPLLYSLPENILEVNVTMGISLQNFQIAHFFDKLLILQTKNKEEFFYKDVLAILKHPLASMLVEDASKIVETIIGNNATHFNLDYILSIAKKDSHTIITTLFPSIKNNPNLSITNCLDLLLQLRKKSTSALDKTVAYQLYELFKNLESYCKQFDAIQSIKTVHQLYKEAIATTSLDYKGNAYQGLQIMGVLETRVLDFDTVIMTSVNEGILPSGKSNASFITYDLKKEFKLPLYTEKDAVYTYHFYRLLQRAKDIYLLYNNHSEGIQTGEKSRFILQLEVEKQQSHTIEKVVAAPKINLVTKQLESIEKTEKILSEIQKIAQKGFSPSSLTNYIRNPIDFYYDSILKVEEDDAVEEIVAASTLGTIVHESLENLYKENIGKQLTVAMLESILKEVETEVKFQFQKIFKKGNISKGKNLLIFEVAKRYIENFVHHEIREIKNGASISIQSLEQKLNVPFSIEGISFPVNLKGTVDRVDIYNGQLRIIDYKTGSVQQGELEITDWETIIEDYSHSKAFQVLTYCYIISQKENHPKYEAGIFSFKNLNSGFLKFATKPAPRSTKKDFTISQEVLQNFAETLTKLIKEICDPTIPFTEKEID